MDTKKWTPSRLRAIRWKLKLSQTKMGKVLGLNQASVSRMESGRQPITPRTALLLDECEKALQEAGR